MKILYLLLLLSLAIIQSANSAVIFQKHLWKNGQTLKILFLNGNEKQHKEFQEIVSIWAQYVHLKFEYHRVIKKRTFYPLKFVKNTIRVSFNPDESNYSAAGNQFNTNIFSLNKMNISASLRYRLNFRKIVFHEFGHALAFLHEHQHPEKDPIFKTDEQFKNHCISTYYHINFSNFEQMKERCSVNLIPFEYGSEGVSLYSFDINSVMLYDDILTREESQHPDKVYVYTPSLKDKIVAATIYPKPIPLTIDQIQSMHEKDEIRQQELLNELFKSKYCKIKKSDNLEQEPNCQEEYTFSGPDGSVISCDDDYGKLIFKMTDKVSCHKKPETWIIRKCDDCP